jgi:hypothetical protein
MAEKAPMDTADKPSAAESNDVVKTAKKKPRPLTYTGAVGDIRAMFQEQASLWRAQAEILEEKALHGTRSAAKPSTQEPWSSLLDDKKRPSIVFEQNNESSQEIRSVRKKIKRTRQWEYKRPEEEEEEEFSQANEENSDEDSDDEAD